MERKQFTFYRSYYDAIEKMPKKHKATAYYALCHYALYDELPEELPECFSCIFELIRPSLDSANRKARNRLEAKEEESEESYWPSSHRE